MERESLPKMSRLEDALYLAAKGFYLFPLIPNTKLPAISDYSNNATRDEKKLREFFENTDHNIAIATTKYWDAEANMDKALIVLDVDAKNGKPGYQSLQELKKKHELPPTFTQKTPTDGLHIIYKSDKPYRQGVNVFGKGIDTRSYGGYVVAAGSSIDGKLYQVAHNGNPNPEPGWIGTELSTKVLAKEKGPIRNVLTLPAAINRGLDYLRNDAPLAVEGDGGNDTTFKVGAKLRDFGISREDCYRLLLENWNQKNFPPWSAEDLDKIVDNVYRYAESEGGVLSAEHDFKPIERENKFHFELFNDVTDDFKSLYLVKGLIDAECVSVAYGDSNSGKTFFAVDLGVKVASGQTWNGMKVKQGAVMYIAAEGGGTLRRRIMGVRKQFDLSDIPFAIVPCSVNLLNPNADVNDLIDLGRQIERKTGQKLRLIVVDTLARALAGGNENASEDMGAFVRSIDVLKQSLKSHVMVVHHSGKDKARGARGHSSLRAATDTEIEVLPGEIRITKQRDMEMGKPIGFRLNQVVVGTDEDGQAVTTCTLETFDTGSVKAVRGNERSLLSILETKFEGTAIEDDLRAEFSEELYKDKDRKTREKAFKRSLTKLIDANRACQVGDKIMLPHLVDQHEFID
jgi:hypothetical protein